MLKADSKFKACKKPTLPLFLKKLSSVCGRVDIEIGHDAVNRAGRRAIRWLLHVSFISIFFVNCSFD